MGEGWGRGVGEGRRGGEECKGGLRAVADGLGEDCAWGRCLG